MSAVNFVTVVSSPKSRQDPPAHIGGPDGTPRSGPRRPRGSSPALRCPLDDVDRAIGKLLDICRDAADQQATDTPATVASRRRCWTHPPRGRPRPRRSPGRLPTRGRGAQCPPPGPAARSPPCRARARRAPGRSAAGTRPPGRRSRPGSIAWTMTSGTRASAAIPDGDSLRGEPTPRRTPSRGRRGQSLSGSVNDGDEPCKRSWSPHPSQWTLPDGPEQGGPVVTNVRRGVG